MCITNIRLKYVIKMNTRGYKDRVPECEPFL